MCYSDFLKIIAWFYRARASLNSVGLIVLEWKSLVKIVILRWLLLVRRAERLDYHLAGEVWVCDDPGLRWYLVHYFDWFSHVVLFVLTPGLRYLGHLCALVHMLQFVDLHRKHLWLLELVWILLCYCLKCCLIIYCKCFAMREFLNLKCILYLLLLFQWLDVLCWNGIRHVFSSWRVLGVNRSIFWSFWSWSLKERCWVSFEHVDWLQRLWTGVKRCVLSLCQFE